MFCETSYTGLVDAMVSLMTDRALGALGGLVGLFRRHGGDVGPKVQGPKVQGPKLAPSTLQFCQLGYDSNENRGQSDNLTLDGFVPMSQNRL
jgi:hypothetical protein